MDTKANYPGDPYAPRPELNLQPPPYSGPVYPSGQEFQGILLEFEIGPTIYLFPVPNRVNLFLKFTTYL